MQAWCRSCVAEARRRQKRARFLHSKQRSNITLHAGMVIVIAGAARHSPDSRGPGEGSMARARTPERSAPALHRKILSPGVYLWRMFFFLVLVGFLIAVLQERLWGAMLQNPGLNFLIC